MSSVQLEVSGDHDHLEMRSMNKMNGKGITSTFDYPIKADAVHPGDIQVSFETPQKTAQKLLYQDRGSGKKNTEPVDKYLVDSNLDLDQSYK